MRILPKLSGELIAKLQEAQKMPCSDWQRDRLKAMCLVGEGKKTAKQIGAAVNVDRRTIFNWIKALTTAGIEGLLRDKRFGKQKGVMDAKIRAELVEKLCEGAFRRAGEVRQWLHDKHDKSLALPTIYRYLHELGGHLKMPRHSHVEKAP